MRRAARSTGAARRTTTRWHARRRGVRPGGNRASAVVQVRIVPADQPNRNPLAGPDVATTPHATPVAIPVLANDSDPDGDPIAVESIATQPAHGRVTIHPDGIIEYTPVDGFSGTDRFVYTLVDGYTAPRRLAARARAARPRTRSR